MLPPWIPDEFRQGLSKRYFYNTQDQGVYSTKSQSDGGFLLTNLPEGRYILWAFDADHRGFIPDFYGFKEDRTLKNQEYQIYSGDFGGRPNYIPVAVGSGKISGPVNLVMERGGILFGRITDSKDGSAIIRAKILAGSWEQENGYSFYSAAAVTDLNGNFIFSGLKEGEYILSVVEAEGYIINSSFPYTDPSEKSGKDIFKLAGNLEIKTKIYVAGIQIQDVDFGENLSQRLRCQEIPVIGRISENTLLLDPRSVLPEEDQVVLEALQKATADLKFSP